MREYIIGVPFPPNRREELKRAAEKQYLPVAAFCRRAILMEMDRIKAEEAHKDSR
jgi:hypothetical protein